MRSEEHPIRKEFIEFLGASLMGEYWIIAAGFHSNFFGCWVYENTAISVSFCHLLTPDENLSDLYDPTWVVEKS